MADNLQLYRVVRFFHPKSSCTTHVSVDIQRITLNASCMTISGGRTKQLDIFCCTSDFISFIELCGTYSVLSRSPSNVNFLLNIVCVTVVAKMLRQCRMWFRCRLVWHAAATFGCSLTALFSSNYSSLDWIRHGLPEKESFGIAGVRIITGCIPSLNSVKALNANRQA